MNEWINGLSVHLIWAAEKQTYAGWEDIRRTIDCHSFYWIHEGRGIFQAEGQAHQMEGGHLAYLHPGLQIAMQANPENPLRMTMIMFQCAALRLDQGQWLGPRGVERFGMPFLQRFSGATREEAQEQINRLVREWVPHHDGGNLASRANLLLLLDKLGRIGALNGEDDASMLHAFDQVRRELERCFDRDLKISELAQKYAISFSYLRKLFVKYTGMSPKQYHHKIRNEQAIRYLLHTGATLREIASACGFLDEFHFSKMFKRQNGLSPMQFRSRSRQ